MKTVREPNGDFGKPQSPGARVVSLVFTPRGFPRKPHDHYTRVPLVSARLVVGWGIEGDIKGSAGKRQLNVMHLEVLEQLRTEGFKTEPGQMGEQIVISRITPDALEPGSRLRLGEAVIEVTIPRTGCERLESIQGRPSSLVEGRLGVLARVVSDGTVRVGDAVTVLEEFLLQSKRGSRTS